MPRDRGFVPVLEKYLPEINPAKIMEWGPGRSTQVMLETCPNASIVTVDHKEKWYKKAAARFGGYENVEVLLQQTHRKKSKYAVCAYDYAPFDFAFVDGRRRVECVFVALDTVKPGGIIMLHDSDRLQYRRIIDRYINVIEETNRTLVFTTK